MSPLPLVNPFESKTSSVGKDIKPTAGAGKTADDIEDLLNDESDDKGKVKDDKEDDKEDDVDDKGKDKDDDDLETDDKDKEDEDDDEEEDKEKIKLREDEEDDEDAKEKLDLKDDEQDITAPPKIKDIEKEFPEFFKKFPFIKRMMFRDRAMTEMFGSFDEAKALFNKSETFNEFETHLLSGDLRSVLSTVKDTEPKAFDKIVDNLLKQIAEVDKTAYDDITSNFAKQIVMGIADEAKRKNDKDLDSLAKKLHEWLFDTDKWTDFKVRVKSEKSEDEIKVERERNEILKERFESARDGLTVKVDNILKATISDYIDPRGQMTHYEKKNAIAETLKRLHEKIGQDGVFRKNLDRLWKSSMTEKFSENSLSGIKKSYLGKAKNLLASVIKEVRGEVLKDNRSKGKDKKDEKDEEETRRETKPVNAGRPHQQTNKAKERQKGESVEEFFSRD